MRFLLFNASKDELEYIRECNDTFQFELVLADFDFNLAEEDKFHGYDAVWITTNCKVDKEKTEQLRKAGIRYVVSRAAGTDHLDTAAMKEAGIKGANVPRYSPNAIAEHTLCLILMALRKMKRELRMVNDYDFTLTGLKGRELRNLTAGVIGTGRIGAETIKILHGFGCEILAYDLYENPAIRELVTYTEQVQVLAKSDIIVLHCPLTKENEKLINSRTIASMKDGVVLINTARGGLMEYGAVLEALVNKKISAAAFDVYDNEIPYIRKKVNGEQLSFVLRRLIEEENVIYTAHMSFYTDTAVENMIMTSFENLREYERQGHCINEVTNS